MDGCMKYICLNLTRISQLKSQNNENIQCTFDLKISDTVQTFTVEYGFVAICGSQELKITAL